MKWSILTLFISKARKMLSMYSASGVPPGTPNILLNSYWYKDPLGHSMMKVLYRSWMLFNSSSSSSACVCWLWPILEIQMESNSRSWVKKKKKKIEITQKEKLFHILRPSAVLHPSHGCLLPVSCLLRGLQPNSTSTLFLAFLVVAKLGVNR